MKRFFIVLVCAVGLWFSGYCLGHLEGVRKNPEPPRQYFNAGASCAALAMLKHRLVLDPFTNLNQVNDAAWEVFKSDTWTTNKTVEEWQAANGPQPATADELTAFALTQPYPIRASLLVVAGAHFRDLDEDLADTLELYAKQKVLAMTNDVER